MKKIKLTYTPHQGASWSKIIDYDLVKYECDFDEYEREILEEGRAIVDKLGTDGGFNRWELIRE